MGDRTVRTGTDHLCTHWRVIVLANVLLGINQGLAWSMTVNMKIDLSKAD